MLYGYYIPGGHLYFRLDIILVKGLSKHTLNTKFSCMKIDPKYAFLHAFFLIFPSCPFQNMSVWQKNTPFPPILHVFAPLNDVRAYIARSWKTTLITWIFWRGWYPTSNTSAPPQILSSDLKEANDKLSWNDFYLLKIIDIRVNRNFEDSNYTLLRNKVQAW